MTAVIASSSGTPAATSAPKATIRISIVIGSERNSARLKSSSRLAPSALSALASPNCSIRRSGWAFWAAAVAFSEDSTRVSARSSSPGIENVTSAERRSLEIWPSLPLANGLATSAVWGASFRPVTTVPTAALNAGSSTVALPPRA